MTPAETRSAVAHLSRRAGFGSTAADVDALAELGYEGAVDEVCRLDAPDPAADAVAPPSFDTAAYLEGIKGDAAARRLAKKRAGDEGQALLLWLMRRMVSTRRPLKEKLAFLWHDHFATSLQKVEVAEPMYGQYRMLTALGPGRFDELVGAVARDPAMLLWLDGHTSTAAAPNENFARELFELFTLGHPGPTHSDHDGADRRDAQAYSERDIAQAARALTGWTIDPSGIRGRFVPSRHDHGTKTVLGSTGAFGLAEVVQLATAHPACATHVVSRLWSRLARPVGPDDPVVRELAATFARDLDVTALLRRSFLHPEFLAPASRTGLVKTPVEYVIGTLRALRLQPNGRTVAVLRRLGQVPLYPPDVSGWPANEAWLSTSTALARLQFAGAAAGEADRTLLDAVPAAERPDAVRRLLGVDRWSDATARALTDSAVTPRVLLAVALTSPEYLLA